MASTLLQRNHSSQQTETITENHSAETSGDSYSTVPALLTQGISQKAIYLRIGKG